MPPSGPRPTPPGPSRAAPAGTGDLLSIRGLTRDFGATRALDSVDLDVRAGSVLALLGHNGAGKSTLIKVLAGVHRPDAGEVTVAGHRLGTPGATAAMAFLHQDLGLVDWMTVAENIALGTGYPRRAGLVSWRAARDRARAALDRVAPLVSPDAAVAALSRAERSLVAVARALALDARLLVLDEPTASLPARDTERLFAVLRSLRDEGRGLVYVSHRLDEVARVADEVAVLRDGRVVAAGPLADTTPEDLVRSIVGAVPPAARAGTADPTRPVVVAVRGLRTAAAGPVDLDVRAGEVVGLVGLDGAGQAQVGRALAGAGAHLAGTVAVDGVLRRLGSPREAVAAGIGFVTSDRAAEGTAAELTVRENLLANPRARGLGALRWTRPRAERATAAALVDRLGVRPARSEAVVSTLSGGNQQKVLVGRWIGVPRRLLVLEEPTAGVDVGAKAEIYRLLDAALAAGAAVVLVSTDAEEVATVCHRALVFVRGRLAVELTGDGLTVRGLTGAAGGVA